MIYVACIAGVLALLIPYALIVRRTDAALAQERSRVNELLALIQVRDAGPEYAFLHPFPDPDAPQYLTSSDGLVSIEIDD